MNFNDVAKMIKMEKVSEEVADFQAKMMVEAQKLQENIQEIKDTELFPIFNETLEIIKAISEVASVIASIENKDLIEPNRFILKAIDSEEIDYLETIQNRITDVIALKNKIEEGKDFNVLTINGIKIKKIAENKYAMPLVDMTGIMSTVEELGRILNPDSLKYEIEEDKIVITVK